jgi:hypothetical protein
MSENNEAKKKLSKRSIDRRSGGDRRKCMMFVEVERRSGKEQRSGKDRRSIDAQRGIPPQKEAEPPATEE